MGYLGSNGIKNALLRFVQNKIKSLNIDQYKQKVESMSKLQLNEIDKEIERLNK